MCARCSYKKVFSEKYPIAYRYRSLDTGEILERTLSKERLTERTLSRHFRTLDPGELRLKVSNHLGRSNFKTVAPPPYVLRLRFTSDRSSRCHWFDIPFEEKEEAERWLDELKRDKTSVAERFVDRWENLTDFRRKIEIRRHKRIFSLPIEEARVLENPYKAVFRLSDGWNASFEKEVLRRVKAFIRKEAHALAHDQRAMNALEATIRRSGLQLDFFGVPYPTSKQIFPEPYYFIEVKTFSKFWSGLALTVNERDFIFHNRNRTLILRQVIDSSTKILHADYFRMI